MKYAIGIDPGSSSGGIATIEVETGKVVGLISIGKSTIKDMFDFLVHFSGDSFAHLEQVSAMPGQGVSSTFKFGQAFGKLEALLICAGIPFDLVRPAAWQRSIGITKIKDETKTAKKNRHKALAQQYFPNASVTHDIADALLIAENLRRQTNEGKSS